MIARAQTLLAEMESGGHGVIDAGRLAADLPLFDRHLQQAPASAAPAPAERALRDRLREVNPDMLAPRDALELLYELRDLLGADAEGDR